MELYASEVRPTDTVNDRCSAHVIGKVGPLSIFSWDSCFSPKSHHVIANLSSHVLANLSVSSSDLKSAK